MKSFIEQYPERLNISHHLIGIIRQIGEYKGKQELYKQQAPEMLENLKRVAIIQSTESSNRLEGITADLKRIKELVRQNARPANRSEAEIAGYRDVLGTIHSNHKNIPFNAGVVLQFHRDLMKYSGKEGGRWKSAPNQISEINPDGTKIAAESSKGWHEGNHNALLWIEYFLSTVLAAYNEFESRLGKVRGGLGSKSEMVQNAIDGFIGNFSLTDIENACPSVSRDWIRKILKQMKKEGKVEALSRGRFARWRKIQ